MIEELREESRLYDDSELLVEALELRGARRPDVESPALVHGTAYRSSKRVMPTASGHGSKPSTPILVCPEEVAAELVASELAVLSRNPVAEFRGGRLVGGRPHVHWWHLGCDHNQGRDSSRHPHICGEAPQVEPAARRYCEAVLRNIPNLPRERRSWT